MKKNKSGKRRQNPPRASAVRKIRVQLAASGDLADTMRLTKPALLYADSVTVYSPAASFMTSVMKITDTKDPAQRVLQFIEIAEQVPSLELDIDPDTRHGLAGLAALGRSRGTRLGAGAGATAEQMAKLYDGLDALGSAWMNDLPSAIEDAVHATGGRELFDAVKSGHVTIAPLGARSSVDSAASSLRAAHRRARVVDPDDNYTEADAAEDAARDDSVEQEIFQDFQDRIIEVLADDRSFPLLDGHAVAIARGAGAAVGDLASASHGVEITSATRFMSFLPSFDNLPLDEVLDLREELKHPLVRFRSQMAKLSRDYASRPWEPGFESEVDDAWRMHVAPALAEIQESLAEHGLLRQVARTIIGDPRRAALPPSGAIAGIAIGLANSVPVSQAAAAGAFGVAALAGLDILGRSVTAAQTGHSAVRQNAFYFLHQVNESLTP